MKEIIIYLVIIAGGLLFDFIKKKMKKSSDSVQVNETSNPSPWEEAEGFDFFKNVDKPIRFQAAEPYVNPETDSLVQPEPIKIADPEHTFTQQAKEQAVKIHTAGPQPVIELDEQSAIEESPMAAMATPDEQNAALAAHYDRWRQALIDAQIIQRKF
ncbi:MAG: hypothetical protein NC221_06940 [Duncaniella sp.]|nr:hypothetical protein [Muribaculum sp.]MCM1255837.1 hypothetical protein [Duncaniella sp.]